MFVYQPITMDCTINAFDTTKYIDEPCYNRLDLYSNKKKATNAIIDRIDNFIWWLINAGETKIEVDIMDKNDQDISCRVEIYGEIYWMERRVDKIKVL